SKSSRAWAPMKLLMPPPEVPANWNRTKRRRPTGYSADPFRDGELRAAPALGPTGSRLLTVAVHQVEKEIAQVQANSHHRPISLVAPAVASVIVERVLLVLEVVINGQPIGSQRGFASEKVAMTVIVPTQDKRSQQIDEIVPGHAFQHQPWEYRRLPPHMEVERGIHETVIVGPIRARSSLVDFQRSAAQGAAQHPVKVRAADHLRGHDDIGIVAAV